MPNISLSEDEYGQLIQSLKDVKHHTGIAFLEERVKEHGHHKLLAPQTCARCGDDKITTAYGNHPMAPGLHHKVYFVCGSCNVELRENELGWELVSRVTAEPIHSLLKRILLERRGWDHHFSDMKEWWSPPEESDNPGFGMSIAEAFEQEYTDYGRMVQGAYYADQRDE